MVSNYLPYGSKEEASVFDASMDIPLDVDFDLIARLRDERLLMEIAEQRDLVYTHPFKSNEIDVAELRVYRGKMKKWLLGLEAMLLEGEGEKESEDFDIFSIVKWTRDLAKKNDARITDKALFERVKIWELNYLKQAQLYFWLGANKRGGRFPLIRWRSAENISRFDGERIVQKGRGGSSALDDLIDGEINKRNSEIGVSLTERAAYIEKILMSSKGNPKILKALGKGVRRKGEPYLASSLIYGRLVKAGINPELIKVIFGGLIDEEKWRVKTPKGEVVVKLPGEFAPVLRDGQTLPMPPQMTLDEFEKWLLAIKDIAGHADHEPKSVRNSPYPKREASNVFGKDFEEISRIEELEERIDDLEFDLMWGIDEEFKSIVKMLNRFSNQLDTWDSLSESKRSGLNTIREKIFQSFYECWFKYPGDQGHLREYFKWLIKEGELPTYEWTLWSVEKKRIQEEPFSKVLLTRSRKAPDSYFNYSPLITFKGSIEDAIRRAKKISNTVGGLSLVEDGGALALAETGLAVVPEEESQ